MVEDSVDKLVRHLKRDNFDDVKFSALMRQVQRTLGDKWSENHNSMIQDLLITEYFWTLEEVKDCINARTTSGSRTPEEILRMLRFRPLATFDDSTSTTSQTSHTLSPGVLENLRIAQENIMRIYQDTQFRLECREHGFTFYVLKENPQYCGDWDVPFIYEEDPVWESELIEEDEDGCVD